jgi:exodeoxyribonuclease V gamma subunit
MLELTYSNRTEALIEVLADRVKDERTTGRGRWEPIQFVVPNPYLKEYLRQALARKLGVAANLQFSYLDGLWKDLMVEDNQSLLAFDLLRSGLLCVLENQDLLSLEGLKSVRDYLSGGSSHLKRVQLATELAKVFEEYQLSRPDWIEAWRAGRLSGSPDRVMESWQMKLWQEVIRTLDGAGAGRHRVEHVTLLERIQKSRLEGMKLPRAIHAFGLSHVAQAYQEVFKAFGPLQETTLHIYALNPCGEFWEDLDTNKKSLWTGLPNRQTARKGPWDEASEDYYELASVGPKALRLWGRPGREKIRLLNEVSECDFTPAFELPDDTTILGKIQRDILLYRDPTGEDTGDLDGSIRCLASPSPRREAEIVATEIWRLVEQYGSTENPLSFSDIAVVVPPGNQEAYLANLQAAFQDAHQIPLVQSDRALPIMRQTLEAVELLLDLPTSGLTRAALLRILQHPGIQRRFGDLDARAWGRWCEEFGIVRGADRAAWTGTYLEQDALNWDQGIKRLTLGSFMEEGSEFHLGADTYLVNGAREAGSVATFMSLVRGLCGDSQSLAHRNEEPREWVRTLCRYLERWLQVDDGEEAEAVIKSLDRIRNFLERMFDRVPVDLEMPRIDFIAVRHLALEALERLKSEQPASLSRGVVVATHATMRAIPFRVIFLMGNGEGSFPFRNQRSALDLRVKSRRPRDVSQIEKEKYLFLELLLSARNHVVLTYVAKDELSGEDFEPSGLFKEFRSVLGGYLKPEWQPTETADPVIEIHPLWRFDPVYFPEWFGMKDPARRLRSHSATAEAEARALFLGNQARSHGVTLPISLGDLKVTGVDQLRNALSTPFIPEVEKDKELVRLSIHDLKTFLECPLTGAAAVRLGLRKRNLEDRTTVTDEPFESEFLETWALQREVALGSLREGGTPEAIYDRCIQRLQAEGVAPFGVFSEVERDGNLGSIKGWLDHLRGQENGCSPTAWRLGVNRSGSGSSDIVRPPLTLAITVDGRPRKVELSGDLRVQLNGSLFLETGKPPAPGAMGRLQKKAIAAYLDHLVLSCVDPNHHEHQARFVFEEPSKGVQEKTFSFPALAPGKAEEQLKMWVQELLTGDHAVLLPIEAVIERWATGDLSTQTILAYVGKKNDDGERGHFSTVDGSVPDPTRYAPPPDPRSIMMARLGDYLNIVCGQSPNQGEEA